MRMCQFSYKAFGIRRNIKSREKKCFILVQTLGKSVNVVIEIMCTKFRYIDQIRGGNVSFILPLSLLHSRFYFFKEKEIIYQYYLFDSVPHQHLTYIFLSSLKKTVHTFTKSEFGGYYIDSKFKYGD